MSQEFKPHHYQYFEYGIKSCYDAERRNKSNRGISHHYSYTLFLSKIFEPTNG